VSTHCRSTTLPFLKRSYSIPTVRPKLPREEQPGVAAARTAAIWSYVKTLADVGTRSASLHILSMVCCSSAVIGEL
jgi:hypothetical protein